MVDLAVNKVTHLVSLIADTLIFLSNCKKIKQSHRNLDQKYSNHFWATHKNLTDQTSVKGDISSL